MNLPLTSLGIAANGSISIEGNLLKLIAKIKYLNGEI